MEENLASTLKKQAEDISIAVNILRASIHLQQDPGTAASLFELGFLPALGRGEMFEDLLLRATDNKEAKTSLATFLAADLENQPPQAWRIFIESGSTLAYFSKALADSRLSRPEPSPQPRPSLLVSTNNFIAQVVLFGLDNVEVSVTAGTLRKDYLAYLPFHYARIDKGNPPPEEDLGSFKALRSHYEGIDRIYAAASHFGFIIGPVVGSRDNALFKYCLFNQKGDANRTHLAVAADKVFSTRYRLAKSADPKADPAESIGHHVAHCYSVFSIPSLSTAPSGGAMDVHAQEMHSAPAQLHMAGHGQGGNRRLENAEVKDAFEYWVDFLANRSDRFELWIGLGKSPAEEADRVIKAATHANQVFEHLGYHVSYCLDNEEDYLRQRVLHYRIVAKKPRKLRELT